MSSLAQILLALAAIGIALSVAGAVSRGEAPYQGVLRWLSAKFLGRP